MDDRAHSYEESLERGERRAAGIYYTPCDIVTEMLSTIEVRGDESFCDPCCGGGNFFIGALNIGLRAENIYGFDSDPNAVEIARERVREATGFDATENIRVADFWDVAPTLAGRFDIVASNPPWGSRIELSKREMLAKRYGAGRSTDSSSLMLLAALTTLREGGVLTFLLPDAFFNIGGFESVRRKILELDITLLQDYGRPFKGLMTRAQAVTLNNRRASESQVAKCIYEGHTNYRTLQSFANNPKSIVNLWLAAEGASAVEQIFSKPHTTLAGNARWGMGIVTGDNNRYCHSELQAGDVEVVRGYNITREGTTSPDTYIPKDLTLYQQVAGADFYLAREKIIYKFISSRPIFNTDRGQHYILNSANAFIPNDGFALSCDEIVERLNSDVVAWLFTALFRTTKILRRDIERLPLHTEVGEFSEQEYQDYLGVEPNEEGFFRLKKR